MENAAHLKTRKLIADLAAGDVIDYGDHHGRVTATGLWYEAGNGERLIGWSYVPHVPGAPSEPGVVPSERRDHGSASRFVTVEVVAP